MHQTRGVTLNKLNSAVTNGDIIYLMKPIKKHFHMKNMKLNLLI